MPTTFQRSPLFAFVRSRVFARNNYVPHCRATHVMASHLFHGFAPYVDFLHGTDSITSAATAGEKTDFETEFMLRGFVTSAPNIRAENRFMHAGPGGGMTGFIDYRHQTRYRKITYYSSGNRSYMNEEAPPQLVLEPWTYTRIELVDEHYGWVYSIEENVTVDEVTVYEYSWVRNLTTGVVTETDPVPTFPTLEWFSWAAIDTDTATAEWTVEETSTTQYAEFIQFVPKAYYDSGGSFDVPDTTQIKTITMEEPYTVTDCYNDAMELLDSIPLSPLPSAATYRINDTDDQSYGWNESIIVEYTGYPVAPRISSTAGDPGAPSVGKWFPNDDTFAANLPLDTDNLVPLDNGFGGWGILVAKIRAQPNAEATCMITTEVNQAVPTTVYTPDDGNAWTEETPVCGTITSGKDVKIGPGDIATSWGRKEFYRFCQTGELLWPECCDA